MIKFHFKSPLKSPRPNSGPDGIFIRSATFAWRGGVSDTRSIIRPRLKYTGRGAYPVPLRGIILHQLDMLAVKSTNH